MATSVTNFADDELLIVVRNSTGNQELRPLRKDHITPAGAQVLGLMSRAGNAIRGHDYGLHLTDNTVNFIHDISFGAGRYLDLDIHCIPQSFNELTPQYTPAEIGELEDLPIVEDTAGSWGVPVASPPPASERGLRGVEVDNDRDPSFPNNFYKYMRTGRFFTVRIKLSYVGDPRLLSPDLPTFVTRIRRALKLWNEYQTSTSVPAHERLRFHIEIVNNLWDHEVKVHRVFPRENSRNWSVSSRSRVIAHEYGHILGLIDEYVRPNPSYQTERAKFPKRYAERKGNPCSNPSPNIMERTSGVIDDSLIPSVKRGESQQVLCCRKNHVDCR